MIKLIDRYKKACYSKSRNKLIAESMKTIYNKEMWSNIKALNERKGENIMINPNDLTDKDVRRLARKPLGTNGKDVKISSTEIDEYKGIIDFLLQCDCRRTYAEKVCIANKVY